MLSLIIAFLMNTSHPAAANGRFSPSSDKDNGGFIIYCEPSVANKLSGYNALDFLYAQTNFSKFNLTPSLELVQEDPSLSVEVYLNRVHSILKKMKDKKPLLAKEFQYFREQLFEEANWSKKKSFSYTWDKKKGSELNVVKKNYLENHTQVLSFMRTQLPRDCKQPKVFQGIRRESRELNINGKTFRRITFHYGEKLKEQFRNKPLQLSMLLTHEWLWNFFTDIIDLMRLNKVLHSQEAQQMTSAELHNLLDNLGFFYDVCKENAQIGDTCSGGAVYAGFFDGSQYMITPAGCSNSETPTCRGHREDHVKKSWNGSLGKLRDIDYLTNIRLPEQETTALESGSIVTPMITSHPSVSEDSAAHYCENMTFGGYDDWYLPSKSELAYIYCIADTPKGEHDMDFPEEVPDCAAFGEKKYLLKGFAPNGFYWSSTEVGRKKAWDQHFKDGGQADSKKSDRSYVRCVRSY